MSSQKYTQEQVDFLASNIKGCRFNKLTKKFNQHFGMNVSIRAVTTLCYRHGLHHGIEWQNKKYGQRPVGKDGRPCNYKPVGSEHVNRDGYTFVKVSDSRNSKNWRAKHMLIWEAAHGPIPLGYVLAFADGDRSHVELDNLILVTKGQMARMNYNHLIQGNPELTRAGVMVADIITKCAERTRRGKPKNIKKEESESC